MPTKNTKVITLRVPNRVDFGEINLHKLVTSIYDMWAIGAIEIVKNEIVVPEEELNMDKFYEVCHDKNIDPQKAMDKCVQMLWR